MAGKRGPKTKEKVVDEIIRLKRRNPGYTASDIKRGLEKDFKDRKVFIPKERAITSILKKNQDKITPSPQDQPWSIGICIKNDIPSSTIPLLIKIQAVHGDRKDLLTIRQALWIAKLYPVLRPLLEKEYSEDSKAQISNLLSIVNAYSIREEIAEIHEQQSPDTSDLDEIFFIKGDVTPEATSRAEFDEM